MSNDELFKAPLSSHLRELRSRLIYSLAFFIIAVVLCFIFSDKIFEILLYPLYHALGNDIKISYFAPHEAFFTYMNLALYSGLLCTMPMLLIQLWRFIAPGLYHNEQKLFRPFLIMTPIMFILGMSLAYFFVMPTALGFFAHFQSDSMANGAKIVQETRISDYSNFALNFLLIFGLAFELPVGVILAGVSGLISSDALRKGRPYAAMGIGIFAAIFTPPDVMSMLLMLIPLYGLYEISIVIVHYLTNKKEKDDTRK